MVPENQVVADQTLQLACAKLTPQQFYNAKQTAMNTFSSEKLGKRAPKHLNVDHPPEMSLDGYMAVSKLSKSSYVAAKVQLQFLCFK